MKMTPWLLLVLIFLALPLQADNGETSTKASIETVLPGTWHYVSDSPTKNGVFRPIEPTRIYWTFESDGSGLYYRKINEFNAAKIHDELRWSVKGKTLTIDGDLHYTIVDWDETRMTWLNPSKKTFIRVEKQK